MTIDEILAAHGQVLTRGRGEYVFHQGEQNREIYFVRQGLLKAYYLSEDGKENIKSFLSSGDTIGSLKGILGEGGCSFSLVCLEPCELVSVNFDILYARSREDLSLAKEMMNFLLSFAIKKEKREYELLCLPAEERFRQFLAASPDLIERVTQNDIARFLGVTPVGLSRIKKRVQGSE